MMHHASRQIRSHPSTPYASILALTLALVAHQGAAIAQDVPAAPHAEATNPTPIQVGLFTPARLLPLARPRIYGLSVNVIQSTTYGVGGVELTGVYNVTHGSALGVQLSAIANIVDEDCVGLVGALVNYCGRDAAGIMVAGLVNHVGSDRDDSQAAAIPFVGLQLAGLSNIAHHTAFSLQLAMLSNYAAAGNGIQIALGNGATRYFNGIQFGGLNHAFNELNGIQVGVVNLNHMSLDGLLFGIMHSGETSGSGAYTVQRNWSGVATGLMVGLIFSQAATMKGLQVAGIGNYTPRAFSGIQIAGAINSSGDTSGLQVSAVNIARNVQGIQIGVVNVARRLYGIQIGLINVAYDNALPFFPIVNVGFADIPEDYGPDPWPSSSDVSVDWDSSTVTTTTTDHQ